MDTKGVTNLSKRKRGRRRPSGLNLESREEGNDANILPSKALSYDTPKLAVILAFAMFTLSNIVFVINRADFFNSSAAPTSAILSLSLLVGGAAFLFLAAVCFLRTGRKETTAFDRATNKFSWKIRKVVADSLYENAYVASIAFVLYAIFFSMIEGVIIYQPSVDFFQAYGVSGVQAIPSTCCGFPGYVPSVSIFFPAQHAGVLIIPINVLLMILISALVALNVTLLYRATKLSVKAKGGTGSGGSLGIVGSITGLFAGCPTCAAAFFLSIIAGSGATAFSFYISQYQILIIVLTLPILIGSIYWQAKSIRILMEGCSV